jgi:hypothetical protein
VKRFVPVAILGSALLVATALLIRVAAQSKPASPAQHPAITIEQVNRWETELSNWGRWGKDDERGALNLITPQKEIQAARLVKDGVTVSLAHFADLEKAADNFNFGPTKHEMFHNPETGKIGGALDINRPIHTLAIAVLGVPLVDNAYLEDVAREAAARKRWEFLITVQFTRIPGGTATPFNALATF